MMSGLRHAIEARWYGKAGWLIVLWPLSVLFRGVAGFRRCIQTRRQASLPVPIIVVGNISVGGTGKTPLIIALVRELQVAGYRPGVISRGYGASRATETVTLVTPESDSGEVGDEPLLIARAVRCPLAVSRNRLAAALTLVQSGECDLILSDDGLQHYRLPREIEIVVVDGSRGFGNGHCLPSGPLREPKARLKTVDWVVRNGNHSCVELAPWAPVPMHLNPANWVNVHTGEARPLEQMDWLKEPAYAVAGIGNPQRFFNTLSDLGLTFFRKPFPDHHSYTAADFAGFAEETVLMTAKDAVKCRLFAQPNWWYLEVAAELPEAFRSAFLERVSQLVTVKAPQQSAGTGGI